MIESRIRRVRLGGGAGLACLVLSGATLAQGGFVERAAEVGLLHEIATGLDRIGESPMEDWVQTGVAIGDLNGDGRPDVVACGGLLTNRVFLNTGVPGGALSFVEHSAQAAIEVGELDRVPALGDADRDGDLDLFIGACEGGTGNLPGRGRLYANDGAGSFEDVSALSSTFGGGQTVHAQWTDVDLDGRLDLALSEFNGANNQLHLNFGGLAFRQLSAFFGMNSAGATHVIASADFDRDGRPDLSVGNDFLAAHHGGLPTAPGDLILYGSPSFQYVPGGAESGAEQVDSTMGIAVGDVDYDGLLDQYKTEVGENYLLLNRDWTNTGEPWLETQQSWGVPSAWVEDPAEPGQLGKAIGWTALFFHADDDPWLDLFVVNGQVTGVHPTQAFAPRQQPNHFFLGRGPLAGDGFDEVGEIVGLAGHVDDRGAALGDLDGDGDLDLVVTPTTGSLRYYENQVETAGGGWASLRLQTGTSAASGIGAWVRWTDEHGYPHVHEVGCQAATASQSDTLVHLSLGQEPSIDAQVSFPSGLVIDVPGVQAGDLLDVVEPTLIELNAEHYPVAGWGLPGQAEFVEVLVHAHDSSGQPLGAEANVIVDVPGLLPLGAVEHVQDSTFRARFLLPSLEFGTRVLVQIDDFAVGVQPLIWFSSWPGIEGSVLRVEPPSVRAGSSELVRLVVCPKSDAQVPVGPGHTLAARYADGGNWRTADDLGDGRYVIELEAPAEPGEHALDLGYDGFLVPQVAQVVAAGAADPAQTEVKPVFGLPHQASAPHQMRLVVTPRDSEGRPLGPHAQVDVEVIPLPGFAEAEVHPGLYGAGQQDSDHVFVLRRDPLSPELARGTLLIEVDGLEFSSVPFQF